MRENVGGESLWFGNPAHNGIEVGSIPTSPIPHYCRKFSETLKITTQPICILQNLLLGIKMGGLNEQTIEKETKKTPIVLEPDNVKIPEVKNPFAGIPPTDNSPEQNQKIRTHLSGSEVHYHDDENNIKTAVPAAEHMVCLREIRALRAWRYLDIDNKSLITITPCFQEGIVDVVVQVESIVLGIRLGNLTKTKG